MEPSNDKQELKRSWPMGADALTLSEVLAPIHDHSDPIDVLKIDENMATIVVGINGTDYLLTMFPAKKQRARSRQ